jgi:hypothetical protein
MKVVVYDDLNEWNTITKSLNKQSILNNPDFIEITCNVFIVAPLASIVFNDEIPILGSVLYKRKNQIVQPNEYFYTSIWLNSKSDSIIQECLLLWISHLTKKFKRVEFNLPPELIDIRPFYWSGFKAYTYYTYINFLDKKISFKSATQNKINKSKRYGIRLKIDNSPNEEIIKYHYNSFINLGYSKDFSDKIACFADKLIKKGLGCSINAKYSDNTEIIASSILILDSYSNSGINFLVSSNKTSYRTGVHSAIYAESFYFLKSKGYKSFDLCIANTKGIGNFKRQFNGQLTPYYKVKFNYWRWQAILTKRKFEKFTALIRKRMK